jgi:hypothetical protein
MLTTVSGDELMNQLEKLSDRMFVDPRTTITRISVIQMLSEDLLQAGELGAEGQRRLQVLEGRVSLKRIYLSRPPTENMLYHSAIILVATLPYGSPAVRGMVWKVGASLFSRLKSLMGREARTPGRIGPGGTNDFELGRALSLFLNALGIYTFTYLFWHEYYQVPGGKMVEGKIAVYDYEKFLEEAQAF